MTLAGMQTWLRGTEHEPFVVWLSDSDAARRDQGPDAEVAYGDLLLDVSAFLHGDKAPLGIPTSYEAPVQPARSRRALLADGNTPAGYSRHPPASPPPTHRTAE